MIHWRILRPYGIFISQESLIPYGLSTVEEIHTVGCGRTLGDANRRVNTYPKVHNYRRGY